MDSAFTTRPAGALGIAMMLNITMLPGVNIDTSEGWASAGGCVQHD